MEDIEYIIFFYNFNQNYDSINDNELENIKNKVIYGDINSIDDNMRMYFIGIYIKTNNEIYLLNDYFGIASLYWKYTNNNFLFSFNIKDIHEEESVFKEAIDIYFSLQYIPAPYTILENIYKMNAGELLIYKEGYITHKYRQFNFNKRIGASKINQNEYRMVRGKQYCFLSGGLDSSTNIYNLSKNNRENPIALNASFDDIDFDELKDAEEMNFFYKKMINKKICLNDVLSNFKNIISCYEEPLGDMASVSTYILLKDIKFNENDMLFSGEGGDEIFGIPRKFEYEFDVSISI